MNNILNWIFLKWFWIEYWIESILHKIQTLNWINLGIEQGYAWVTRPERPKGFKDEVKQAQSRPEGRPTRSRAPEGPLDF